MRCSSDREQSTRRAERVADLVERVGGEEGAERLLLQAQQLALVELLEADRRVLGAGAGARLGPGPPPPRSKIEPWPELRVLLGLLARGRGMAARLEHALAGAAGGVERAALDQALDRALVDRAGVDPLAEVPERGELAVRPSGRRGSPAPRRGRRS